ncbi:glycerophosphodiester phosphodiesterase family protein [Acuticoccus sp. I52.16.1]|uniref:glycerophosphodiester phosphodiesterase family protein n=1 Tax=Acuticoccus sp. I52.16.1 TaxID=2928472 RepID=UPI001FD12D10|nr:glycerophosphodiester phosphodiesterase family protein [Acuticoccus sp. I52.16.1]UOM36115.1 glycerophosphodiester phosphodiesterase [Acuticoccus sp. I52.16.1]
MLRRPVAHRGLHGAAQVENTLGAVEDAIDAGYAVEVDLQLTVDGGLVVTHDETLDRMTAERGRIAERTLDELRAITITGSSETFSSLTDLLALTAGRAPLFLEAKAPVGQAAKASMAGVIARALGQYGGAAAVMTFDPDLLALLRSALPDTPLGILAGGEEHGSLVSRFGRDMLLHTPRTKPDFVGYYATALPHPGPALARRRGRPVLAWTVRSQAEAQRLSRHVDQIIFEDFRA